MRRLFGLAAVSLLSLQGCSTFDPPPVCGPDHLTTTVFSAGPVWQQASGYTGRVRPGTPVTLSPDRAVTGIPGVNPTQGIAAYNTNPPAPGGELMVRLSCTPLDPNDKASSPSKPWYAPSEPRGWFLHLGTDGAFIKTIP